MGVDGTAAGPVILRRELRPEGRPPSLRFRPPNVHIPLWLLALGWAGALAWRGLRWLAVHPRSSLVLAVAGVLLWTDTVLPALGVLVAAKLMLAAWWAIDPGAVRRRVLEPVQLRLREQLTYRRDWQPAMLTCGLSLREQWGGDLPTLRTVRNDGGRDVLRVRMLPGQTGEQWQAVTAALAQTFGARSVRVRRVNGRPQELDLLVTRRRAAAPPLRHVTEPPAEDVVTPAAAGRAAFPRAPRGGAA